MLKQRVITAIILLPLVLGAIFYLPNMYFAWVMLVPLLVGAFEWANMMGIDTPLKRMPFVAGVTLMIGGAYWFGLDWIIPLACLWWLLAAYLVITFPDTERLWAGKLRLGMMGCFVLVPTWMALVLLQRQPDGSWLLLYVMSLVWGADTGAYFAGRRWGTTKLAPRVSPGKSMAGLWGGLLTSGSIACVVGITTTISEVVGLTVFLLISVLTVFASVLGDLLESMVKRHRGIKDSGNILPGHGGILDRIDSVTSAVPVYVGLMYLAGGLV